MLYLTKNWKGTQTQKIIGNGGAALGAPDWWPNNKSINYQFNQQTVNKQRPEGSRLKPLQKEKEDYPKQVPKTKEGGDDG